MCNEDNTCCLANTLQTIIKLQNNDNYCDIQDGCDKPFLGPTPSLVSYNTRPISLYNCFNGDLWSFPTGNVTSTVFRAEAIDDCCLTCRVLIDNGDDSYTSTNDFFTINLKCVCAMQCHNDVFIDLTI